MFIVSHFETFEMKPTSLSILIKFVYNISKFTGYHFSTYKIDQQGNIVQSFTFFDLILFFLSSGFSFIFGLLVKNGLNLEKTMNSIIVHLVLSHFTNFSFFMNFPMKISYFMFNKKLSALFRDVKICSKMVRTCDDMFIEI